MAYTNAWSESLPLGSENASTTDNYLRQWRKDLGERLEGMFYGFNSDSNTSPENDTGIKNLKMYKQTSDPTKITDFGHFYVKLVGGIPELFYQDDANTTLQITTGGKLSGANMSAISANSGTTNTVATFTSSDTQATIALADDSTSGGSVPILTRVANALFINQSSGDTTIGNATGDVLLSSAAGSADRSVADKAYVDAIADPAYSGGQSHVFDGGLIIKMGEESVAGNATDEITYGDAFPTAAIAAICSYKSTNAGLTEAAVCTPKSGSEDTVLQVTNGMNATQTISWIVIGH